MLSEAISFVIVIVIIKCYLARMLVNTVKIVRHGERVALNNALEVIAIHSMVPSHCSPYLFVEIMVSGLDFCEIVSSST